MHLYGFSPVWILIWNVGLAFIGKTMPHSLHPCPFCPLRPTILLASWLFLENDLSHSLHACDFSPLWNHIWRFCTTFPLVCPYMGWLHVWLNSSVEEVICNDGWLLRLKHSSRRYTPIILLTSAFRTKHLQHWLHTQNIKTSFLIKGLR